MFKRFSALVRGRAHDSAERILDQNALTILHQQIRDCTYAVAAARKSVAIAIAQNEQEICRYEKIVSRIKDLEGRTIAAIEQGKDDLAHEAAETIAYLEVESDASLSAQKKFNTEILRLKRVVRQSEMRLRDLERGQRLAAVNDKAQRLRTTVPHGTASSLKDAEATLARLQARQMEIDAASNALDEMMAADSPASMSEKLAAAGCGAPIHASGDDVIARLTKSMTEKSD